MVGKAWLFGCGIKDVPELHDCSVYHSRAYNNLTILILVFVYCKDSGISMLIHCTPSSYSRPFYTTHSQLCFIIHHLIFKCQEIWLQTHLRKFKMHFLAYLVAGCTWFSEGPEVVIFVLMALLPLLNNLAPLQDLLLYIHFW